MTPKYHDRPFGPGEDPFELAPENFSQPNANYPLTRIYEKQFFHYGSDDQSGPFHQPHNKNDRNRFSHYGKGPKNYHRPDASIAEDIYEALTWDRRVDASDIQVDILNGTVTLRGVVHSKIEKRTAEEIVENIYGVLDVSNQLQVK